jgi:hypothetical protein
MAYCECLPTRLKPLAEIYPRWTEIEGDYCLGMLQNTRCSGRGFAFAPLAQVRKTPSWPRSWANFSLL